MCIPFWTVGEGKGYLEEVRCGRESEVVLSCPVRRWEPIVALSR